LDTAGHRDPCGFDKILTFSENGKFILLMEPTEIKNPLEIVESEITSVDILHEEGVGINLDGGRVVALYIFHNSHNVYL